MHAFQNMRMRCQVVTPARGEHASPIRTSPPAPAPAPALLKMHIGTIFPPFLVAWPPQNTSPLGDTRVYGQALSFIFLLFSPRMLFFHVFLLLLYCRVYCGMCLVSDHGLGFEDEANVRINIPQLATPNVRINTLQ